MRRLRLGRYLVEWSALLIALLALGEAIGARVLAGQHRAPVFSAVLVVAFADVPVYLLVARGLVERPEQFMLWWGMSLLGKFAWFGAAAAAVILVGRVAADPFLLTLGVAFPVFTVHQVLRLVRLADTTKAPDRTQQA